MRMKAWVAVVGLALFLTAIVSPAAFGKPEDKDQARSMSKEGSGKEVYTGTIYFVGGRLSGRSTTFSLTIDGDTSTDDFDRYLDVLKSKGQDGLLDAVRKERRGRLQLGSEVGQDINILRIAEDEEGGKKITAAFTRWMRFAELRAGSRTTDYPFSYFELVVDSKGKGSGTFIPLARIAFDKKKNVVEVENFGAFPAKLIGVRKRRA